jgi:hypothetical protein
MSDPFALPPLSPHQQACLAVALEGATARLSMLPPKEDGTKAPRGPRWKRWQVVRAKPDTVRNYFEMQQPSGVGVVCGRVSRGLECLDFDEQAIYHEWKARGAACGLGPLIARLEADYLEYSPSGVHLPWHCEAPEGNLKLARRPRRPEERRHPQDHVKVLIETWGEGGYIIIAPTNGQVHPDGGAYTRLQGSLATIGTVTAEEREALLDLARSFDAMPVAPPREPRTLVSGSADQRRPGDEFNARTDWPTILEPYGWVAVYERDGVTYWRRPGKNRGISASTNYKDSDLLYPFTSSTVLEPERSYTKFGAWTVLKHGGDFAAAARALGAAGYGAQDGDRYTVADGTETVSGADIPRADAKSDTGEETVSPFQSEGSPASENSFDEDAAPRDGAVRPPGTPWPKYAIGGCVYEAGTRRLALRSVGARWQVSVYDGPRVLASDKVDLASAKQRHAFARLVPGLNQGDLEALDELLLGLALVAQQDYTSWESWHANQQEASSARAEQFRQREAEAEAQAAEAARAAEAQAQGRLAAPLLERDDLLYQVGQTIGRLGVVGEEANRILLYLLFTSRVLNRSISGVVKGDSAGGKNNLVERTAELIPPDAHIDLSGMSERALIYDQRDYAHRTLVFFEAQGQQGEMQEYLIRSLISEGRLLYGTVEKIEGQLQTVTIEKQGPTNFITTTTAAEVHAENETRLWSLVVDDSETTTGQVLALQAQRAAGQVTQVDTAHWLAAQRWLEQAGAHAAIIPFAPELAKHLPRKPLRLRRDHDRLLGLIEIIAVLYQRQRERDAEGRVIATLADYAMARELVEPTLRAAVYGVTQKTLDLVAALNDILAERGTDGTANYSDLAARTGKRKAFISRWLRPAIEAGLVVNLESEKGKTARLQRGPVAMDLRPILPPVATLLPDGQTVRFIDPLTGKPKFFPEPPPPSGGNGETVDTEPGGASDETNVGAKSSGAEPSPDRCSEQRNGSETVGCRQCGGPVEADHHVFCEGCVMRGRDAPAEDMDDDGAASWESVCMNGSDGNVAENLPG